MVSATCAFTINDTLLKLAVTDLPPFESIFLRGIASLMWSVPLLAGTGNLPKAALMFDPRVMFRNVFELAAVLGFIIALATMPLPDISGIGQLAPMLVMLGAVVFYGEHIGRLQLGLIVLAFGGALLVAQPGGAGFSALAIFAFWNAFGSAARDLAGRRVGPGVPGLIVAAGSGVLVTGGAGLATLVFETWQTPNTTQLLFIAASGLFLMFGHTLIFSAYRQAPVGVVVPFTYTSTLWALISGVFVFSTIPNLLALAGIALILVCGISVVVTERWRSRILLTA